MSKDFNLVYRSFVAELIRELRRTLISLGINPTDKMLAKFLSVEPNTVSRLRRACFNASPKVLVSLIGVLSPYVFLTVYRKHFARLKAGQDELFAEFCKVDYRQIEIDGIKFNSDSDACPANCYGDCEHCVKG